MPKIITKPRRWQLQEAKAKFSRLVKEAQHGPQVITLHGQDVAVVQSMDAYKRKRASQSSGPNLLEILLACPKGPPLKIHRNPADVVPKGPPLFR